MKYDFGNGPIEAERHKNPDKTLGGWVAHTAIVDQGVYIGKNCKVFDMAEVYEDCKITGNVQIYGKAEVFGQSKISGDIHVYGNTIICAKSVLSGDKHIKRGFYGRYKSR